MTWDARMKRIVFLAMASFAIAQKASAGACFVDHVEAAPGGLNIYMDTFQYPGGPLLSVEGPNVDAQGEFLLFSYNRPPGIMMDGKWVPRKPPPIFTYMAVGQKAYVDADIHNGCGMTVETSGSDTILHLQGGTSLPGSPQRHFDIVIRPGDNASGG